MSGGGTNTVSQQTVPSWLQPYYTQALQQGQTLEQGPGPAYYPGNQVAPLNSVQEGAINTQLGGANQVQQGAQFGAGALPLLQQGAGTVQQGAGATGMGAGLIGQAAQGPSATPGAMAANQFETSGALLNPSENPYLKNTFTQGANAVQNQLSSEFAGSGRNIIGSAPVQSDEMNNLATQLYGGAYNQGLQTMTQASALAPSIDAGMYLPGNEMMQAGQGLMGAGGNLQGAGGNWLTGAGSYQGLGNNVMNAGGSLLNTGAGLQGQTQNLINQNVNAWNYQQQLPYNQLSYYSGLLGQNGSPFASKSGSTTGSSNPWGTGLGVGLLGNSLIPGGYASLFGTGMTAASMYGGGATAGMLSAADLSALSAGVGTAADAALAAAPALAAA